MILNSPGEEWRIIPLSRIFDDEPGREAERVRRVWNKLPSGNPKAAQKFPRRKPSLLIPTYLDGHSQRAVAHRFLA